MAGWGAILATLLLRTSVMGSKFTMEPVGAASNRLF
jgi:hypothetical protein